MSCDGFAAEVYDLFALGALEGEERVELERHLAEACETCLRSVKRSLSIWPGLGAAITNDAESPVLRSRIVRMAELSKSMPALSEPSRPSPAQPRITNSWFIRAMAALITVIVGSAAWYAGRQSAAFGTSHVIADLQQTQKDTAAVRLELEKTKTENSALQKSLDSLKGGTIANDEAKLQARATGLEAELSQYKAALAREERAKEANGRIAAVLATPGVRLVPLKGVESAAHSTVYSLITDKGGVLLVASGLPVPSGNRQYQLWFLRKEEPKATDGGLFSVEADGRAVLEVNNPALTAGMTGLAVTEEPQGGSPTPTGAPILTASIEAAQQ
jgi:anti-sigma-K factor RskA